MFDSPGTTARFYECPCEGLRWLPAQFALDFTSIDRVPTIMARAVGDIADQLGVGLDRLSGDLIDHISRRGRGQYIEQGAHGVHDLDVSFLVPATDVVSLAQRARFQHATNA